MKYEVTRLLQMTEHISLYNNARLIIYMDYLLIINLKRNFHLHPVTLHIFKIRFLLLAKKKISNQWKVLCILWEKMNYFNYL